MADQSPIIADLEATIETTFGAGSLVLNPQNLADLRDGEGTLIVNGYSIEELEFLQDRISYAILFAFVRTSANDPATVRDTMFDDLETVRAAVQLDPTLGGAALDCRVVNLGVQSGDESNVIGVLEFSAVVVQ